MPNENRNESAGRAALLDGLNPVNGTPSKKVGRPKKIPPAQITRDLKAGIIEAAAAYGNDGKGKGGLPGYLFMLAGRYPKAFASLLGKMLPLQVNGDGRNQTIAQINIVSVPIGQHLSPDDARRLSGAPIIDHDAAELADRDAA